MFAIETGWPPPELLVTVSMISGICSGAFFLDQPFQRRHIHVAFEVQARLRVGGFGDREVHGPRALEFDIGPRGVEMRVTGNHLARAAHHGEQDALRRPPLVRGNHVAEAGQLVHHALHAEEALAACVGFVAAHDRRPLLRGHGAGAGVRQQVDQDVARANLKQVVAGLLQVALPLRARGVPQRLDAFDAERLYDSLHCQ